MVAAEEAEVSAKAAACKALKDEAAAELVRGGRAACSSAGATTACILEHA